MTLLADLDTLRRYVGATNTTDDDLLGWALESARQWVDDRVCEHVLDLETVAQVGTAVVGTSTVQAVDPNVENAVLMMAARLYQRRRSVEGVAGFSTEGIVTTILSNDPDLRRLLERKQCYTAGCPKAVGIG